MSDASLAEIYDYFSDNKQNDYKMGQFRDEWKKLTDQDKADLKKGIGDRTLTY